MVVVARGFSFSSIKRSVFRPLGTGAGCPAAIFIARPSSSGTSPNVFKIVASPKFPMFGSPRQRFQIISTRTKSSRLSHSVQQKYFLFGGLGWHMMGEDWEPPQATRVVIRSTGVLAQQSGARGSSLRPSLRAGHRVPSGPCSAPSRARLRAAGRVRPPAFPAQRARPQRTVA
jgi:hypothetical protein